MLVTFRSNAGVGKYRPGRVYTEELNPLLKALLEKDTHLQLIDPPTLNPVPVQEEVVVNDNKVNKKPYNNSN